MAQEWDILDAGFEYHVVAVFGSQSTGKSTLLNKLFGTEFDVMNETERRQTTKGIWMSKAKDSNVLVLDVEGTDGRERGEDQDFERKSALFSLAIAEVVIVNMWEHMIGLYNGANMGLLKTVFEVNLELFQQSGSPKTHLLFVIRDFTGVTPLENLSKTLMQDLERIWAGLSKPPGKEMTTLQEFFDLSFCALPHKIFASAKFNEDADLLATRFYDKSSSNFVFQPKYHKKIPADGFPSFANSIWTTILSNRDLDLPTQQQLLAQYRCDEIESTVYSEFVDNVKPHRTLIETGKVVPQLGAILKKLNDTVLSSFDKNASRYHQDVYQKKKKELTSKLSSVFKTCFMEQVRVLHKKHIQGFLEKLKVGCPPEDPDFMKNLKKTREIIVTDFNRLVDESCFAGCCDLNPSDSKSDFITEIDEISSVKKSEALDKMKSYLQKRAVESLSEPILVCLDEGASDIWPKVGVIFKEALEESVSTFTQRYHDFELPQEDFGAALKRHKFSIWEKFIETLKSNMLDVHVLERLRNRFDTFFKYDTKGIPRVWKSGDEIDPVFASARDEAEKLMKLLAVVELPLKDIDSDITQNKEFDAKKLTLLSPARSQALTTRFKRDAETSFVDAKRAMTATTAKIPVWFIVMTVVLGWNEFLAVMRSPLFFLTLALLGGAGYLIWSLGLTSSVMQITNATAKATYGEVNASLKEKGLDLERVLDGSVFIEAWEKLQSKTSGVPIVIKEKEIEMEPVSGSKKRE